MHYCEGTSSGPCAKSRRASNPWIHALPALLCLLRSDTPPHKCIIPNDLRPHIFLEYIQVCEYEKQRDALVAENQALLAALFEGQLSAGPMSSTSSMSEGRMMTSHSSSVLMIAVYFYGSKRILSLVGWGRVIVG